ncbi:MAG: hypothetical protein ABI651_00245 [Verrucomicrobiota bacterium]
MAIVLGFVGIFTIVNDLSAGNIPLRNNSTHKATQLALSKPYWLLATLPALSANVQLNLRPIPELNPELVGALLLGFVGWNERKRLLALLG